MDKLSVLINDLETKIPFSDKLDVSISRSPVGWHIQHTVLATRKMIEAVSGSNPENYRWQFNLKRVLVFSMNKIPRGKGKAPQSVLPTEQWDESTLIAEIRRLKSSLSALDRLMPGHHFDHPYFGRLNLKATRKILVIHTRHHMDIINDIINR